MQKICQFYFNKLLSRRFAEKYAKSIAVSLKNIFLYEIPVFRYKNIPMQKNTCFAVSVFSRALPPALVILLRSNIPFLFLKYGLAT